MSLSNRLLDCENHAAAGRVYLTYTLEYGAVYFSSNGLKVKYLCLCEDVTLVGKAQLDSKDVPFIMWANV